METTNEEEEKGKSDGGGMGGEGGVGGGREESEGKQLAEFVKETHRLLRGRYKAVGGGTDGVKDVWREHVEGEERLQRYATAMQTLATQYWPSHTQASLSRVGWVRGAVGDYFCGGGGIKAAEKERRKLEHLGLTPDQPLSPGSTVLAPATLRVLDIGSCYNPFAVFPEFEVTALDLCPAHESVFKGDFLNLDIVGEENQGERNVKEEKEKEEEEEAKEREERKEKEEKDRHGKEEEKNVRNGGGEEEEKDENEDNERKETNYIRKEEQRTEKQEEKEEEEEEKEEEEERNRQSRKRKDRDEEVEKFFCKSNVTSNRTTTTATTTTSTTTTATTTTTTTTLTSLEAGSYDVAILSLVLEYLPCPNQRYEACRRCYSVLSPGGVLVIVTPDSKHVGTNAHLYQLWRVSLAGMGFVRVKYEKQQHFHGFVFRKAVCQEGVKSDYPRLLACVVRTSAAVRNKYKRIDYSKVNREMYIPQDFDDDDDDDDRRERGGREGNKNKRRKKS